MEPAIRGKAEQSEAGVQRSARCVIGRPSTGFNVANRSELSIRSRMPGAMRLRDTLGATQSALRSQRDTVC